MDSLIFQAGLTNDLRTYLASLTKTDLGRLQYFTLKDKLNKKEEHFHYNEMIKNEVKRLEDISEVEIKLRLMKALASIFEIGEIDLETEESINKTCQEIIESAYNQNLKVNKNMGNFGGKHSGDSKLETMIFYHLKDYLDQITEQLNFEQINNLTTNLYNYLQKLPDIHIIKLKKILEVQDLDEQTLTKLIKLKKMHSILEYLGTNVYMDPILTMSSFLNIGSGLSFPSLTVGHSIVASSATITGVSGLGTNIALPSLGSLTGLGISQASLASLGAVQASLVSGVAASALPTLGATTGLSALPSLSLFAGPLAFAPLLISGGFLLYKNSKLKKKMAAMTVVNIGLLGLIELNKY